MKGARDSTVLRRALGLPRRRRRVSFDDARRFAHALRGRRRGTALRAVLDGSFVFMTLRHRGLRPLLRSGGVGATPSALDADSAAAVSAVVDAGLGILPMRATCLRRSVTLLRELRRLQHTATLHIGVRHRNGAIQAHAWVQVGDVVVNDDPTLITSYARLSAGDAERLLQTLT